MMIGCSPQADLIVRRFECGDNGRPLFQTHTNFRGDFVIGWGHVIKRGDKIAMPLSYERANMLLTRDLLTACNQLREEVKFDQLKQHQVDALSAWLLHVTTDDCTHPSETWRNSTLLKHVREGYYALAASEFEKWCLIRGKINEKALARRQVEARLFAGKPL